MGFHYPEEIWILCIKSLTKALQWHNTVLLSVSYYNNAENMQKGIANDSLS